MLACCLSLFFLGFSGCNSSPGPTPGVTVTTATDLGAIQTNSDILVRDGAYSATFEGHSVWLYGDTFLANPDASGRTLLSDSWSFTTALTVQDNGISGWDERRDSTGAPTMILEETPAEQAYDKAHAGNPCQQQPCGARWALWPAAIVVDPASNQALVFYMVVNARPGSFNFQGYGSSVALWQEFQGLPRRPTLNSPLDPNHPDLMFGQNDPSFGSAAFISNGTLYVYGCHTPSNIGDQGCRVAKVPPATVQDRTTWMFYARDGNWSSLVSDAVSVIPDGNIMSVAWNDYLQQYIAIYSPPFSQNVVLRTAHNPEGPWSASLTAFVAVRPTSGNVYDAHAHPEYDANGGQTTFVTYSRSTGDFSSELRLVSLQLHRR
jgi:hypothetical protein